MFLLAERPHIFPGRTLLGSTTGPVVDTGCDLDFGGRVYLSRQEVWEAARLHGFIEPEVAQAQEERISDLEAQLAEANEQLEELEPVAKAVVKATARELKARQR